MDRNSVDKLFDEGISEFDRAISKIKQCAAYYERISGDLIKEIAKCENVSEAEKAFDELYGIQGILAVAVFTRKLDLGRRLTSLTKEFDRLYDPQIREYWLKRFQEGAQWPE